MPWVFTYSDLGPQILEKVLERAPFCSLPATLPSYKVSFRGRSRKWGGAIATIDKAKKSWVYGSVLLLPPDDIRVIDKYYAGHESKEVNIFIDATQDKVKAKTYFLKSSLPYGQPSDEYIKAILKHLKFFWGQTGSGRVGLENFNIKIESTEDTLPKKGRKKKQEVVPDEDKVLESDEEPTQETETEEKPKKRRRRRAVKKK